MKKLLLLLLLLLPIELINAQHLIELNVQLRGSNMNGLLGTEFRYSNFSISESWRPQIKNVNSFITTFTYTFKEIPSDPASYSPYLSIGYSTKGSAYTDKFIPYEYVKINDIKFCPAVFLMGGFRNTILKHFNSKSGIGFAFSKERNFFVFEVSVGYTLFSNKFNLN
jgi:hypothetical protein